MANVIAMILVLIAILVPCLAIIFAGLWISRRLGKDAPDSLLLHRIKPMEIPLWGNFVVVFLVGAVVRQIYPMSPLGAILNTPAGLLAAFVAALLVLSFAHAVLTVLLRRRAHRGPGV